MEASTTSPAHRRGGFKFPVLLIVVGTMLLLNQLVPGWGLCKTWPVLLVVLGILKLVDATRPPRPPRGPRV